MAIKTCSVAVSSYILFKEQLGFSLKSSAGLALSASVLTLLLEKIRPKPKETNDWFECKKIESVRAQPATNYDQRIEELQAELEKLKEKKIQLDFVLKVAYVQIVVTIVGLFYTARFGFFQKDLISLISENKLKWIPMATLVGPIVEEILFRGFLTEWMEIGCDLIDRHLYAISKESQHHISNFAQAIVFGAGHMMSKNRIENALIFASTGIFGFMQGFGKRDEEGSLRTPIKQHIKQNTISLFIAICLIPTLKKAELYLKKS